MTRHWSKKQSIDRLFPLLLALMIVLATPTPAWPQSCCPAQGSGGGGSLDVVQHFPAGGPMETAWWVRYGHRTGEGLFITGAWFKKGPSEPWTRVLWDARLSDIFVPYHTGSPRYLDLSEFNFDLVDATRDDAGCCGTLVDDKVIKEVRDRGPLWKEDQAVHRGQELVLWGTLKAAYYNYIIEYGFQDDGTITFRLAATGVNRPSTPHQPHMHNGLWRVDIDLNGFANDTVQIVTHQESTTGPAAQDQVVPYNGGKEGAADWKDAEFTQLRVHDTRTTNRWGENIAYDLRPLRRGTPRHQESYTHHDFWVSRFHPTQLRYTEVETYVQNRESVTDTDVVLWYISPAHHHPRREDGHRQNYTWKGVALVMWTGFELRPWNLFDGTPLYPSP